MSKPIIQMPKFGMHRLLIEGYEPFKNEDPRRHSAHIGVRVQLVNEKQFLVSLDVELPGREIAAPYNYPYAVEISVFGGFVCAPILDLGEGIPDYVLNNALLMLYGAARGIVAQVSGIGPFGRFILPAMIFDDVVEGIVGEEDSVVYSTSGQPFGDRPKFEMIVALKAIRDTLESLPVEYGEYKQRHSAIDAAIEDAQGQVLTEKNLAVLAAVQNARAALNLSDAFGALLDRLYAGVEQAVEFFVEMSRHTDDDEESDPPGDGKSPSGGRDK